MCKTRPSHIKWKSELWLTAANTEIGLCCMHAVHVPGGSRKQDALRLDVGDFFWGSECSICKTRMTNFVYSVSNTELVLTKTLVKNCFLLIDSTWYWEWLWVPLCTAPGVSEGTKMTPKDKELITQKQSTKIQEKYDERKKNAKIENPLEVQFHQDELPTCIASGPGQCDTAKVIC